MFLLGGRGQHLHKEVPYALTLSLRNGKVGVEAVGMRSEGGHTLAVDGDGARQGTGHVLSRFDYFEYGGEVPGGTVVGHLDVGDVGFYHGMLFGPSEVVFDAFGGIGDGFSHFKRRCDDGDGAFTVELGTGRNVIVDVVFGVLVVGTPVKASGHDGDVSHLTCNELAAAEGRVLVALSAEQSGQVG